MHPDDEREAITTGRGELPDRDQITYKGWRDQRRGGHTPVYRIGNGRSFTGRTLLEPAASLKLRNHSPDGFEWGYGGSGPAQLSLALVLDATDDPIIAVKVYQDFKDRFTSRWGERWEITQTQIRSWVCEHPYLQCTKACTKARGACELGEAIKKGHISESAYMNALCDHHFDLFMALLKEEEEGGDIDKA